MEQIRTKPITTEEVRRMLNLEKEELEILFKIKRGLRDVENGDRITLEDLREGINNRREV